MLTSVVHPPRHDQALTKGTETVSSRVVPCCAGKDKVVALIQYAAMFTSGGEPGLALNVQKSFSAARKPFRLYKV